MGEADFDDIAEGDEVAFNVVFADKGPKTEDFTKL